MGWFDRDRGDPHGRADHLHPRAETGLARASKRWGWRLVLAALLAAAAGAIVLAQMLVALAQMLVVPLLVAAGALVLWHAFARGR